MNNSALKFISQLADKMPNQRYGTRFYHEMRGDDIHASDELINKDGNRPDRIWVPVEVKNDVNHKRRMKRAYKSLGVQGVIDYVLARTKSDQKEFMKSYILSNLS